MSVALSEIGTRAEDGEDGHVEELASLRVRHETFLDDVREGIAWDGLCTLTLLDTSGRERRSSSRFGRGIGKTLESLDGRVQRRTG